MSDDRPPIATIKTGAELRRWYWLKAELIEHARELGLKTTSGKFVILDRIAQFLDTGDKVFPGDKKVAIRSAFDWHKERLTLETVITDSYKNSQNVRRFFASEVGAGFKFNIEFMAWMKANAGKTLQDACAEYKAMREGEKQPGFESKIAAHNQFNQYTRDFLADNPGLGLDEVRRIWALKVKLPSDTGRHVYEPSDLDLGK